MDKRRIFDAMMCRNEVIAVHPDTKRYRICKVQLVGLGSSQVYDLKNNVFWCRNDKINEYFVNVDYPKGVIK